MIEANAPHEVIKLDFPKGEQRSPNTWPSIPRAACPPLVTERGMLTETPPALLAYVARRFPEARLAPLDDAYAFAHMQDFHSYLSSTVHVAHAHGRRAGRWADDEAAIASMQRKVAANMAECFGVIEAYLGDAPWVLGADYSVADAYLFTIAGWLEGDGVDIAGFPQGAGAFQAHGRARCRARGAGELRGGAARGPAMAALSQTDRCGFQGA
ncbi:putative RNA-binding protein 19 [Manis javanica]|nr:putative RNA-binding protein 19 [Manis javanica]